MKKIGIIGAGNMGSGIAQKVAQEGLEVVLIDTQESFVQKGMENIKNTLDEAIQRRILTPEKAEEVQSRITGTTEMNLVADADIVIEVIFENLEVKKELFGKLDTICEPKTILASNTSSLSIAELANSVNRKDRFIGLHFFYHPAKNRLLEIIPISTTSPEVIHEAKILSKKIGKTSIDAADTPGFAVNRFFVPWLNEATRLLEENIGNIPTIDHFAKKVFKIGMGPFELMNVTGIPIAYHSTVSLSKGLGKFYEPSKSLASQFDKKEPWNLEGDIDESMEGKIEQRLLGAVFIVACQLVEENIANLEDTDRGAKIGLRWSSGPFEIMNSLGIDRAFEIVTGFASKYPDLAVPRNIISHHDLKKNWQISYVDLSIENGIANILINKPEVMNSLNEKVMSQLDERFTTADQDPGVKAIVLEGAGKAFIAGADIQYFIDKIDAGKINEIVESTGYWHSVLRKFAMSQKPVIAKLDGLALGGGAEIALACDTIIATEKASIGFPETGIGIYPGLGGTQRTPRIVGKELAKYLILTGKIIDAKTAAKIGLIEYLASSEEIDNKILELVEADTITKSRKLDAEIHPDFLKIKEYFSDASIQNLIARNQELDEMGQKLAKTVSFKAPMAIQMANKLIDEGSQLDLDMGLKLELDNLDGIFRTKDAREGLGSVMERRRPVFSGE